MRKNQTTLPVKGIHSPALFLWCRGLFHGKLHTGSLNRETGVITSPYLTGQTNHFYACLSARREQAEKTLAKVWVEADQILIDLAVNSSVLCTPSQETTAETASPAQLRAMERAESKRADRAQQSLLMRKRLAEIKNLIEEQVNEAQDQAEATAHLMLSKWAAYGHGLLLKPVIPAVLPVLAYEDCIKQIISRHQGTWDSLSAVLKEVKQ